LRSRFDPHGHRVVHRVAKRFEHHLGRAAQAFERDFWICQNSSAVIRDGSGIGFVLMVSLVVSRRVTALGKNFSSLVPDWSDLSGAQYHLSFLVITSLFARFSSVAGRKIAWRDVSVGAAITALLFTIGKFALWSITWAKTRACLLMERRGPLVLILLWFTTPARFFLWSRIDRAYANRFGVHLAPKHMPNGFGMRVAPDQTRKRRPEPKAGGKSPTRDRRSELVEELKQQVHSIRRSTGH